MEIIHHHLGTRDRRVVHQPVLVFDLADAVHRQPPLLRIGPCPEADLSQPPAVIGEYRHPADIGLDRRFFEQGLQHLDIARGHAIFGRWCQLARNRHGTGAQRLIQIVYFPGNELKQQQDPDDRHRHHGQNHGAPPYPQ